MDTKETKDDEPLAPAYLLSFRCRCGREWRLTIEIPLDDWPPRDDGSFICSRCACGVMREFRWGRFIIRE